MINRGVQGKYNALIFITIGRSRCFDELKAIILTSKRSFGEFKFEGRLLTSNRFWTFLVGHPVNLVGHPVSLKPPSK